MSTFNLALEAWQAGAELRNRRSRYKKFAYGRQWDDMITTPDGDRMSERAYAEICGQTPLTNNVIRQLIKSVVGNFRSSLAENDGNAGASEPDSATARRNSLTEMDCRMLEEFLISGCAIQRIVAEKRPGGSGVWVDNVSPDDFFVNRYCDPRGLDIELIGMLRAMSLREVVMRYGSTPSKAEAIGRAYARDAEPLSASQIGSSDGDSHFFRAPAGRCRVIEVWTLESRTLLRCHDRERGSFFVADNNSRTRLHNINELRNGSGEAGIDVRPSTTLRWHCRVYAPTGLLLDDYDSPFGHGSHPFALKLYPLIDGEVHSLVEDVIGQQRHINRIITLIDHIMSVSAKGVLLFPEDQKIDSMSWDELGAAWARSDSVLPYRPGGGSSEPHQVVGACENPGAYRMLETQLNLFQQISGVSENLRGRMPAYQTSAATLDSQLHTSAIAMLDLIDTFNGFRMERNRMMAATMPGVGRLRG